MMEVTVEAISLKLTMYPISSHCFASAQMYPYLGKIFFCAWWLNQMTGCFFIFLIHSQTCKHFLHSNICEMTITSSKNPDWKVQQDGVNPGFYFWICCTCMHAFLMNEGNHTDGFHLVGCTAHRDIKHVVTSLSTKFEFYVVHYKLRPL